MSNFITVILPTYNPNSERLKSTIDSLKNQSLGLSNWELIIIDNNSSVVIDIDLSWHPNAKMVKQPILGLTFARIAGFGQATGDIIVMVDDDNILTTNYLENVASIFASNEKLGAIGGKSMPLFDCEPPIWLKDFYPNLALRDLGETQLTASWKMEYPQIAPIGAGMGIRTIALTNYLKKIATGGKITTDRTGNSLSSGGDNDIILEILKASWHVGYFPELLLQHIIPQNRMLSSYLAKLVNNSNKSWVLLLESHGINPWHRMPKWSLPIRKLKAYVIYGAWKNKTNYINWQGACGLFDGLASIKNG